MTNATIAGRYRVERSLGQGSFGRTLLAHDLSADRAVAIKLLDARGGTDWKAYELFEREAAVLRSLRHHGIPEVYDSLRDKWEGVDTAFLVMEYVDGVSLLASIESGVHLEAAAMMHLLLELLSILEYLHGRVPPILHRDIKPANIIVRPDDYPALVDFGSVRRVFMSSDESGSTVAGTYGYMPYEQYMGQASPASDLYAVGATMLHLLTGRPPRDFMNEEGRIAVPGDLPGDPRLRAVISRMLRPSPAERFASAQQARAALLAPAPAAGSTRTATVTTPQVTRISPGTVATVQRREVTVPELPAAPRELTGNTRERYDALAHSMWQWMDPESKDSDATVFGVLSVIFFSVITAGVLPLTFLGHAHSRRRRLRRFFRDGSAGVATITGFGEQDAGFGVKFARVSYEFEADDEMHRDSDTVLTAIAQRWRAGDVVQILYLPEGHDSIIISAS
jgi:serine/threonine protein kinase